MKRRLLEKMRFSEIRRDQWLASIGKLSRQEAALLRRREIAWLCYRMLKSIILFPLTVVRMFLNLVKVLNEFERLHFLPLRKIQSGKDCVIDRQTWLQNGQNIMLGDFVKISAYSSVLAGNAATIRIGTNSIVGPGVTIVAINHGTNASDGPIRYQRWKEKPISIGADVWIGSHAVILPGAVVGDGCVIGAGAVIRGEIPPMTISYVKDGVLITVPRKNNY